MGYFDDLEFLGGHTCPGCTAQLVRRFPYCSLEFIRSGRMYMGIDGSPRVTVEGPCAFWHHPAHLYDYGAADAKGWDHHWMTIRGERAMRLVENCLIPLFPGGYARVLEPDLFDEEFHALIAICASPDRRRHPEAVAMFERLVAQLAVWGGEPSDDQGKAAFEALFETIKLNPVKEPDFKSAAKRMGMSYGNFRRLFKLHSGRAPHDFALHCRMRLAAEMLQAPGRQIKDVASELGYADQAQFSKLFKGRMGLPPEEYRRCLSQQRGG